MTPALRASDAEREQVVDVLREHTAEGRLNIDEFSQRSQAAYAARTRADLAALTNDLPVAGGASRDRSGILSGPVLAIVIAVAAVALLGVLGVVWFSTMASHMREMPMM